MAVRKYYSDSEEFLMGISTGVTDTNDSNFEAEAEPVVSDNEGYAYMLLVTDDDAQQDQSHFYNGASLDYIE